MKELTISRTLILQGWAFISLVLLPAVLGKVVQFRTGYIGFEELLAIGLPFLWIMLSFLSFDKVSFKPKSRSFFYLFMIGIIFILLGQGIHLSANFLNDHLFVDLEIVGEAKEAAYFYDEVLGHYLWTIGYLVMVSAFFLEQYNYVCHLYENMKLLILTSILNGVVFAISAIEGQVVTISLVYSITVIGYIVYDIMIRRHVDLRKQFCFYYFELVLFSNALVLIIWGLVYGGYPQLTEAGLF